MQMREEKEQQQKNPPAGVEIATVGGDIHVLPIIGQIEGHYVLPENQFSLLWIFGYRNQFNFFSQIAEPSGKCGKIYLFPSVKLIERRIK